MISPQLFKGIALFTPGGDLIYCIDYSKQSRWHSHLCLTLQEIFALKEPPHFLVPAFSATIDLWLNPQTQQVSWLAEVSCGVQRYQSLLNIIFDTPNVVWRVAPWQEQFCSPVVINSYREQFPQLWEHHDLLIRYHLDQNQEPPPESSSLSGFYVLYLFVSGHHSATEKTLETLHKFLEITLPQPYTLKIIDISKQPEQAEKHQISATPTLMRMSPLPVRRLVGQIEDQQKVLQILTNY